MGLGKYYCDYCEKEFQDNPAARKRHLHSSSHLRAKSLWYRSFHHPQPPPTCHRFLNTGFCPFGDSCSYSHSLPSIPNPPTTTIAAANNNNNNNVVSDIGGVSLGNLPPSLRPPPEGGYPPLPFLDWG